MVTTFNVFLCQYKTNKNLFCHDILYKFTHEVKGHCFIRRCRIAGGFFRRRGGGAVALLFLGVQGAVAGHPGGAKPRIGAEVSWMLIAYGR